MLSPDGLETTPAALFAKATPAINDPSQRQSNGEEAPDFAQVWNEFEAAAETSTPPDAPFDLPLAEQPETGLIDDSDDARGHEQIEEKSNLSAPLASGQTSPSSDSVGASSRLDRVDKAQQPATTVAADASSARLAAGDVVPVMVEGTGISAQKESDSPQNEVAPESEHLPDQPRIASNLSGETIGKAMTSATLHGSEMAPQRPDGFLKVEDRLDTKTNSPNVPEEQTAKGVEPPSLSAKPLVQPELSADLGTPQRSTPNLLPNGTIPNQSAQAIRPDVSTQMTLKSDPQASQNKTHVAAESRIGTAQPHSKITRSFANLTVSAPLTSAIPSMITPQMLDLQQPKLEPGFSVMGSSDLITPAGLIPPNPQLQTSAPVSSAHAPQVATQIAATVVRSGTGTTQIILNPEELGRVRLTLSTTEHGLAVVITAERPETIDLMRRHADLLAQELDDLGQGEVAFSFDQNGQNSAETESKNPNSSPQEPDILTHENIIIPILNVATASGLDLKL